MASNLLYTCILILIIVFATCDETDIVSTDTNSNDLQQKTVNLETAHNFTTQQPQNHSSNVLPGMNSSDAASITESIPKAPISSEVPSNGSNTLDAQSTTPSIEINATVAETVENASVALDLVSTEISPIGNSTPSARNTDVQSGLLNLTDISLEASTPSKSTPSSETTSVESGLVNSTDVETHTNETSHPIHNIFSTEAENTTLLTPETPTKRLGDCDLECQNEGVCRVDNEEEKLRCICSLDFTGEHCETPVSEQLTDCYGDMCHNDGKCVEEAGQAKCICPSKAVGQRCSIRVYIYKVTTQLYQNSQKASWIKCYNDPSCETFKNVSERACGLLRSAIQLGKNLEMVASYKNCSVVSIAGDDVTIAMELHLSGKEADGPAYPQETVKQQLLVGGRRELDRDATYHRQPTPNVWFSAEKNVQVEILDPCESGLNDCSPHADCIPMENNQYICRCRAFTIDRTSEDGLVGRHCAYDGVVIFVCVIVGLFVAGGTIMLCGCRRVIWSQSRLTVPVEVSMSQLPASYEI